MLHARGVDEDEYLDVIWVNVLRKMRKDRLHQDTLATPNPQIGEPKHTALSRLDASGSGWNSDDTTMATAFFF